MRQGIALYVTLALVLGSPLVLRAQADWVHAGQDPGATKFSTLDQINTDNVRNLTRAWTFHTGDDSGFFESGLLVVDGVMYFSAQNGVYALDAATGEQIWKYETTATARRGPLYWAGANGVGPRIFSQTSGGLAALDPADGTVITTFGIGGFIRELRTSSPPVAYRNVLITQGGNSTVKAWDAITGAPLWTLHLKAQPGDPNISTWLGDSWETAGGPGLWGCFSVDVDRGLLFVPVEKVGSDYYGGRSHGTNLYSNSLLAVNALTGEIVWYQQLTHHDIWDMDPAAAPTLFDAQIGGRTVPSVGIITKMGLLFLFDRLTGEPLFGMEERPVPQTTVPSEWTFPTQPFPVKPPPLARNSITKEELAKVTPELEAYCLDLWDRYNLSASGPYTPWQMDQDIVLFPGAIGGGNWGGTMYNKPLGLIITNVMTAGQWGHLEERGSRGGRGGGRGGARGGGGGESQSGVPNLSKVTPEGGRFWEPETRYSCAEPPWGELVAVDANTGDIAWHVPLGAFDELEAMGIKTGQPGLGGGITTAGNLVFIGATIDGVFRAFDARTGEELWGDRLEAPAHSIPSTYLGRDGRQYVAVPSGGGGFLRSPRSDAVVAWRIDGGDR